MKKSRLDELKTRKHTVVYFDKKKKNQLVFMNKKCIFAPLINRGRVPQNLIIRLCQ